MLCLRQIGVLAGAIVERPKFNHWRIADGLDDVNIVLADIFGFTRFTNRHSPDKVFSLLDEVCGGWFNYAEFGTCPVSG